MLNLDEKACELRCDAQFQPVTWFGSAELEVGRKQKTNLHVV